jgi:hypothetical protein
MTDNRFFLVLKVYLVLPTTTWSSSILSDLTIPTDLISIKLDENWKLKNFKVIAQKKDTIETYVTWLKKDENNFYISYLEENNISKSSSKESSVINIFNLDFKSLWIKTIKKIIPSNNNIVSLRPSLEITKGSLYFWDNWELWCEIYLYELIKN